MRTILFIAVILVISGSALYITTSEYDSRRDELARLDAQIKHENQQAAILNAEWSYLSRPERVLTLSSDLLSLQPISTDRVLPLEAIPFRDGSFELTTDQSD
ncbi:MAG: cell division protein FtsL [Candidatus Puniceispirillaceae bacterium]